MKTEGRLYRTPVLILNRRDYHDADRVLTVFTPALGKQEFIAKGIRKTTSRKAGHLELFTHSLLMVAQARTWHIITEAVSVESYRYLRENLEAIGYANYICELIDCFTETDDENQPLWDLLLLTLRTLDEACQQAAPEMLPVLLRWYELHLLSLTGFQPQLFQCLGCQEPLTPIVNYLCIEDGGVYCPRCGETRDHVEPLAADVLKILRHLQRHTWQEVGAVRIRPPILYSVENILHRYLLVVLERQLKSTNFLRKLAAMPVLASPDSVAPA